MKSFAIFIFALILGGWLATGDNATKFLQAIHYEQSKVQEE